MKLAREQTKMLPLPPFNAKVAKEALIEILRNEVQKTSIKKAVIGLSGGIDSALSLAISVEALGKNNVLAIMMPYEMSSSASITDALEVAEQFSVKTIRQDITAMANAYFSERVTQDDTLNKMRKGNVLARLRMIVLYDQSAAHNSLVIGTSNKTEIFLGYSTLWGDMASAVNPIGDLFKTQVFALAQEFGITETILKKPPSADLWEGQSDEKELNMSYDFIDRVLSHYLDKCWSESRIIDAMETKLEKKQVVTLLQKIQRSQFKRKMPVIAKISRRTTGREFRYPRDWML